MKKITLIAGICALTTASAFADQSPAIPGFTISGQGSYNLTPKQTFNATSDNINNTTSQKSYNGGFGGALFLGYNYAITPNITIGGKAGYQYIYQLNEFKGTYNSSVNPGYNNAKNQINVNNIPVLATANYYFDSGFLVGVEGGIDIQKWTLNNKGDNDYIYNHLTSDTNYSSNWNIAPMAGISFGYQWQSGIALTASADYIFGKSTSDITSVGKNHALAMYTTGINLSYTF